MSNGLPDKHNIRIDVAESGGDFDMGRRDAVGSAENRVVGQFCEKGAAARWGKKD